MLAALGTIPQLWLLHHSPWFFVLFAQLLVLPDFRRQKSTFLFVLATLLSAFAATVTGTFLVAAMAVQGTIRCLEIWAHRRPLNTAVWLIGLFILLAAARVGPVSWAHHLQHVFGGLPAYGESFSLPGAPSQALLIAAFSGLILIAILVLEVRSHGSRGFMVSAAYCAVALVVYKMAVVRPDRVHIGRAFYALAAFSCTFVLVRGAQLKSVIQGTSSSAWRGWAGLGVMIATGGIALYWLSTTFGKEPVGDRLTALANAASTVLTSGFAPIAREDDYAQSEIRLRYPLPAEVGKEVGVFGTFQSPVIAYRKRNIPLPIAAHYEVWTPRAIAATNQFLRSAAAPNYLLYTGTNQSASNAVTIAQYYETLTEYGPFAVLRRRKEPLVANWRRIFERDVTWDEVMPIAPELQGRVVVAKLDYDPTFLNRLVTLLYQPPRVYLVLYSGRRPYAKVRLNRLILGDGVVLAAYYGTWDGRSISLHGRRHPILTVPQGRFSDFALTVEGPMGAPRARGYFAPRVHVRLEQVVLSGPMMPQSP